MATRALSSAKNINFHRNPISIVLKEEPLPFSSFTTPSIYRLNNYTDIIIHPCSRYIVKMNSSQSSHTHVALIDLIKAFTFSRFIKAMNRPSLSSRYFS